jgi:hypothetical protein
MKTAEQRLYARHFGLRRCNPRRAFPPLPGARAGFVSSVSTTTSRSESLVCPPLGLERRNRRRVVSNRSTQKGEPTVSLPYPRTASTPAYHESLPDRSSFARHRCIRARAVSGHSRVRTWREISKEPSASSESSASDGIRRWWAWPGACACGRRSGASSFGWAVPSRAWTRDSLCIEVGAVLEVGDEAGLSGAPAELLLRERARRRRIEGE